MNFIYNNKVTGTFVEFSIDNIDTNLSISEAIDAFMNIVKEFSDNKKVFLPSDLLNFLTDKELDLFLLASYSKEIYLNIENMIYVVLYNKVITDKFGISYNVEYSGKYRSIISFEALDNLEIFNTSNTAINDGIIDIKKCKREKFIIEKPLKKEKHLFFL